MNSIVVLTTQERADWFRAALGADADFKFSYEKMGPLRDMLANVRLAGGSVVVLDEEFFPSAEKMLSSIESYVNEPTLPCGPIRLVVVCSRRTAKDQVLFRLAGYCHIYDLLYGVDGVEIIAPLRELIDKPRKRSDVISLLDDFPEWPAKVMPLNGNEQVDGEARTAREAEVPGPLVAMDLAKVIKPGQRLLLEVIVR